MPARPSPAVAALAVAALAGGCERVADEPVADEPLAAQTWQTENVWRFGTDRLELEERDESLMGRPMFAYRVRLFRRGMPLTVIDTRRKRVHATAARLPDGRVAWLANDVACTAGAAEQPSCVDLGDVSRTLWASCADVVAANARCRSAFDLPDAPLSGALRWVAGSVEVDAHLPIAALVALARSGDVPEPLVRALATASQPDQEDTWLNGVIARVHGDPPRIAALRRTLAAGSQVVRRMVARSCVPELAADVAAARAGLQANGQPDFAEEIADAEKRCAALPRPRR